MVTPTATDAERLWHDVRCMADPGAVELFPAWDTLPFERVSPEVQTMGQRLSVLWRLRWGDDRGPGRTQAHRHRSGAVAPRGASLRKGRPPVASGPRRPPAR